MYYTTAKENWEVIDKFKTMKEARKAIAAYLKEDRETAALGETEYDPNFYTILDENKNEIEIYTAAATLGRKGGAAKTAAKKKASRENGKLSGRPKSKK